MDSEFITMTSKGQVVIPARFRKALGMKPGTRISVQQRDGQLIFQPVTDEYIDRLFGILGDTTGMIESLKRDHELEDK
jgi:AbrB family looped-hinge helix DNA binding protein